MNKCLYEKNDPGMHDICYKTLKPAGFGIQNRHPSNSIHQTFTGILYTHGNHVTKPLTAISVMIMPLLYQRKINWKLRLCIFCV